MAKRIIPKLLKAKRDLEMAEAILDRGGLSDYAKQHGQVTKRVTHARSALDKGRLLLFEQQGKLPEEVWRDSFDFYNSLTRSCEQIVEDNDSMLEQSIRLMDSRKCYVARKTNSLRRAIYVAAIFLGGLSVGSRFEGHIAEIIFSAGELLELKIKEPGMKPLYVPPTQQESWVRIDLDEDNQLYPAELDSISNKVNQGDYVFVVDKDNQLLHIYQKTEWEKVEELACSTGKNQGDKESRGDNKTPEGLAYVVSIEKSQIWGIMDPSEYGPYFMRLKYEDKNWEGIGIHGTNEPERLGSRASRGCIRLSNENVEKVVEKYVWEGIPCLVLGGEN
ncbi:MAG: L,D-transpeptidase [archaeon]